MKRIKTRKTKQEGKKVGEEQERKDLKKEEGNEGGRRRGNAREEEGHLREVRKGAHHPSA